MRTVCFSIFKGPARVVVALFVPLLQSMAHAAYPEQPIRVIIPFAAGGNADLVGRVVSARMGETLGQAMPVENRVGAGGAIGAEAVAKAPPDGYTLLVGSNGPLTVNPVLQAKLRYDPFKDFVPISIAGHVAHVLVVTPSLAAKNFTELAALSRKKPIAVGSGGLASATHLTLERLIAQTGAKLEHIPYKGGNSPVADLVGGNLESAIMEFSTALQLHQSGKARIVGIAASSRSKRAPDVPTFHEQGVTDFLASSYVGFLATANTPVAVVERLQKAANEALANSAVLEKLTPLGFEPGSAAQQSSAGFGRFIRAEFDSTAAVVKSANIKVE